LFKDQDKDKDLSSKDNDKEKDFSSKDKDQDKDCILALKESLRTRTRTNITAGLFFLPPSAIRGLTFSSCRLDAPST